MGRVVIDGVEFLFNKLYRDGAETDEIVADMFSGNKLITYVEMEAVTIINYGAFYACSNLTTAIFKNLRVLGNHVFAGCNFKTIDIPNVISIGNLCFATNSLEKITLNDEITEIEYGTFNGCQELVNIHLPENLEKIGERAFYNCKKLYIEKLPENLKTIGVGAFYGVEKLAITQLPKQVNIISDFCFEKCYGLTNLTLGGVGYPVITIGNSPFYNCTNLKKLTIYTTGGQPLAGAPWGATNATITYLSA
ncbi:leucine-rich repeat domain-containing protein [Fusobacterium varium]|uniref:leucine-rich repeat domain-containing protein n=1 Tax=Fusobacterium varium TaxID=856 RepID=UPI000E4A4AD4|nr:leucine-rich repeat domain-containing protein [Fusobacterium varium]RHG37056.1 leucine-rich repeat domain-containing protein [Fusobacterium varium]